MLDASEAASPARIGAIDEAGRMLQSGDTLVVVTGESVVGYDVSDAENPVQRWSHPISGRLRTARLADGRLYLVTASRAGTDHPCPVSPLGEGSDLACGDIYRPADQIRVEAVYSVLAVDVPTGSVEDAVGFVGPLEETVVHADGEGLYVAYRNPPDVLEHLFRFTIEVSDVVPANVKADLREVRQSDRSREEKITAAGRVLETWFADLSREEEQQMLTDLSGEIFPYLADQERNIVGTGNVHVPMQGELAVAGHTTVPGKTLNQFSMGVHEGTVRITTSVMTFNGRAISTENDLYVLDAETLGEIGSETGFGGNQEVFAVRYVGEFAYVVTVRQVDPFHVIDLSDPSNPREAGEVELPGVSTYLHPLSDDRILGVGREGGSVKAVSFDVSDPTAPAVAFDLVLNASWSGVAASHHAFMLDERHGVFFLPTGEEGVVIEYSDDSLSVATRVAVDGQPQRARYVGDYLYVFGTEELVVLEERTWTQVDSLPIDGPGS